MFIKPLSLFLTILLVITLLSAQGQSSMQLNDSVTLAFKKFIQAKTDKSVVLFTDRDIYIAGEKIWLKAYVLNSGKRNSDFSFRNLFADLVNEKDSVVEQLVLDNIDLRTGGVFHLPALLPTGFYWIRCYTASQLGAENSGIFLHRVLIINKQLDDEELYAGKLEKKLSARNTLKPVVHFFAERLTAIPGIISTGVLEIKDANNNPLSVTGNLVNSKDSAVVSFKTDNLGLARLTFINDPSEKYTVVFNWNNQAVSHTLPPVNKTAIQLSVANQTAKKIKAFVTMEDDVPTGTKTIIMALQRDSMYFAAAGAGNYGITIPLETIPGGIINLLLFDTKMSLIDSRNIYIGGRTADLQLYSDKSKYAMRENVNVHIKLTRPDNKPLTSMLNVAVQNAWIEQFSADINAGMVPPSDELLLEDWLNRNGEKYNADDIDLLMVTRKQNFIKNRNTRLNKPVTDYDDNTALLNLTGRITNKTGSGMSDRIVTMITKDRHSFFMDTDTTRKDGVFRLAIPQGLDSLKLSLQVTNKRGIQTLTDSIKIDSFHFPEFSTSPSLKKLFVYDNPSVLASVKKYQADTAIDFLGKGWIILAPVIVKSTKQKELNYDVSKRINSISQILTRDKFRYGGANALGNAVLMVPGVSLFQGEVVIFGPDMDLQGHVTKPLLVVDGVPMPGGGSVLEYLNELNPADIDFIEVLRGAEAAFYGMRGTAGVISVNTMHSPDYTSYSKNNLRLFSPVTYHVSPIFEMPDYSDKKTKDSPDPDLRTTIYWNGNIKTNVKGEADISFYMADKAGNYTITVTGLTEKGDIVYKQITIENTGKSQ
jgi:hypothetical protein